MSDVFHSHFSLDQVRQVFEVIEMASWHQFQLLTKRPERALRLADALPWPENLWLGTSVENASVLGRVDRLRRTPAAVKFLSCEPLLGPLDDIDLNGIDWVIGGGESGHGFRPCDPTWARGLRDCCQRAGVAFFWKQWGGRTPKAQGRELDGRIWHEFPRRLLEV
jgi:protein gp37